MVILLACDGVVRHACLGWSDVRDWTMTGPASRRGYE